MLEIPAREQASRLREFFEACGYTEQSIQTRLGSAIPPPLQARPKALYLTRDHSLLNTLLRLFFLSESVSLATARAMLDEWLVDFCLAHRLLTVDGASVTANAALIPLGNYLFASDPLTLARMESSDFVLPASSTTALYMLDFILRRPVATALDLGTGCGVLAHFASECSGRVVATDISSRACEYARFNARLNGLENIDVRTGNLFEPVSGERFDLIVSNPPFVLAPSHEFEFRDNDMLLDEFCGMLARSAPNYLEEGGCFQMICEWVETGDEPWHERLGRWFSESNCDVWVLHAAPEDPERYAQVRIAEVSDREIRTDAARYSDWLDYYREHGVTAIRSGVITMRRREGVKNWMRLQALPGRVEGAVHDVIEDGLLARDRLDSLANDQALLDERPHVSPDAQLEQLHRWFSDRWKQSQATIRLLSGFRDEIHLDQVAIQFVTQFDGTRSIAECISRLAEALGEDADDAISKYLPTVRALIERGFLMLP
jgi:hypothetical protein